MISSQVILLMICILLTNGFSKSSWIKLNQKFIHRISAAVLSSTLFLSPCITIAEDDISGFQSQLQILRQQKNEEQKNMKELNEQALMTKELLYPEGKVISRGIVYLTPKKNNIEFDKINFPYGLMRASEIDEELNNDRATIFVLAVGREGPPVAARKYSLKDLSFPFVFEITTDDLFFPYTPEAWSSSPNSKDSVAVSAVISTDEFLATPSFNEWVGFGLSNPVQFAGRIERSSATVNINNKIDKGLYSENEVKVLSSVDSALNVNKEQASVPNK